jgi:hypothetical protein
MATIFIPFGSTVPIGGAVVATGAVRFADAIAAGAGAVPVTEMAFAEKVGDLVCCKLVNGTLQVVARIRDAVAKTKVVEKVYQGLCLVLAPVRDALRIEGAALVDTPNALQKRSGAKMPPATLSITDFENLRFVKGASMSKQQRQILLGMPPDFTKTIQERIRDERETQESGLEMIRAHLARGPVARGNAEVGAWLAGGKK